jgi:hypothetical protein
METLTVLGIEMVKCTKAQVRRFRYGELDYAYFVSLNDRGENVLNAWIRGYVSVLSQLTVPSLSQR